MIAVAETCYIFIIYLLHIYVKRLLSEKSGENAQKTAAIFDTIAAAFGYCSCVVVVVSAVVVTVVVAVVAVVVVVVVVAVVRTNVS